MKEKKTCCFLGHRKISGTEELKERLYKVIEDLIISEYVHTFLFGSRSEFDSLCLDVVTELKNKYPFIQRVYVRAEFQHISGSYAAYLLQSYDDTYYPERISGSGRAAYVERNQIMINCSDICVVYFKDNYLPSRRKNSWRDLTDYQPKSGTKIAYEYAVKKGKKLYNLFIED